MHICVWLCVCDYYQDLDHVTAVGTHGVSMSPLYTPAINI